MMLLSFHNQRKYSHVVLTFITLHYNLYQKHVDHTLYRNIILGGFSPATAAILILILLFHFSIIQEEDVHNINLKLRMSVAAENSDAQY